MRQHQPLWIVRVKWWPKPNACRTTVLAYKSKPAAIFVGIFELLIADGFWFSGKDQRCMSRSVPSVIVFLRMSSFLSSTILLCFLCLLLLPSHLLLLPPPACWHYWALMLDWPHYSPLPRAFWPHYLFSVSLCFISLYLFSLYFVMGKFPVWGTKWKYFPAWVNLK